MLLYVHSSSSVNVSGTDLNGGGLQTAATMTMNSPESLVELHKLVSESKSKEESVYLAELIREIGLKCIGFNGVRLPPPLQHQICVFVILICYEDTTNNKLPRRIPRWSPKRHQRRASHPTTPQPHTRCHPRHSESRALIMEVYIFSI